jgi:co-chaperonin GroES (HSP10)
MGEYEKRGAVVPQDTKPCDQVLIGKRAGTDIKLNGETSLVMHEADIVVGLEEEADTKSRYCSIY